MTDLGIPTSLPDGSSQAAVRVAVVPSTVVNQQIYPTENPIEPSNPAVDDASVHSKQIWDKAASILQDALDPQIFAAWIKPLEVLSIVQSAVEAAMASSSGQSENAPAFAVELGARNAFTCDHVKRHYSTDLESAFRKVLNVSDITLRVKPLEKGSAQLSMSSLNGRELAGVIAQVEQKLKSSPSNRPHRLQRLSTQNSNLNPKYNFSNFVVGACNQFAHAVSLRVSETPGSNYNPLFIYGGVGLGKTHLVNAIGNAAKRRGKNVLLVSSELFVNELIAALRSNQMQQFKERFRSLDMLIIDDIQFIIGKERTQEEFFHTFNALHQRHSQIIITCDKVPQEMVGLEDRLRTRFASGLSADLQAPDFETRVAILMRKSEADNLALPDDVARLLAEKIDTNVRELEGALNRLHALSSLNGQPMTVDLAEGALRTLVPEKTRELTTEFIQKVVAERFNTNLKDLLGKRRTQNIAFPRQVAMYLCRRLTTCSYPEIGVLFGGRDHSTVIHANRVIDARLKTDPSLRADIDELERKLKGK